MVGNMIIWTPGITLEQIEKQVITEAYNFCTKNSAGTAKLLNTEVDYINKKLIKYENEQIEEDRKRKEKKLLEEEFKVRSRGVRKSPDLTAAHTIPPKKSANKKTESKLDA